jgi:hypothetical protein
LMAQEDSSMTAGSSLKMGSRLSKCLAPLSLSVGRS